MIECIRFTKDPKGARIGFADVRIVKWGYLINGVALFEKEGKRWIGLPSKSVDGGEKWRFCGEMEDPEHQKIFLKQIQEAVFKKACDVDEDKETAESFDFF